MKHVALIPDEALVPAESAVLSDEALVSAESVVLSDEAREGC